MNYYEEYGDVTKKLPEYVSAHCISEDCAMGSGVVLAYRSIFPGLKAACVNYVEMAKQDMSKIVNGTPKSIFYDDGVLAPYRHTDEAGVVYNMFTKKKYWFHAGKGMTYEEYLFNLRKSLELVKLAMIRNHESKIAMPMIASKRDRCDWKDVKDIINEVFKDTDIEICICIFEE